MWPLGLSYDFSPASLCGPPTGTCFRSPLRRQLARTLPEPTEVANGVQRGCCSGLHPSLHVRLNSGASLLWQALVSSVYTPGCNHTMLQPLQAVSMQPTPVFSLGLSSKPRVSAPSPCPYQVDAHLVLGAQESGTDHLCRSLSFCLLQTGCCALR